MIHKFRLISNEDEEFIREFSINSSSSFLDFHKAIIKNLNYSDQLMTSFFLCNNNWEKQQEITLIEMGVGSDIPITEMSKVKIEDVCKREGQKLLYVFDMLMERSFFIDLFEIHDVKFDLKEPKCTLSEGYPPKQSDDLYTDSNKDEFSEMDSDFETESIYTKQQREYYDDYDNYGDGDDYGDDYDEKNFESLDEIDLDNY